MLFVVSKIFAQLSLENNNILVELIVLFPRVMPV